MKGAHPRAAVGAHVRALHDGILALLEVVLGNGLDHALGPFLAPSETELLSPSGRAGETMLMTRNACTNPWSCQFLLLPHVSKPLAHATSPFKNPKAKCPTGVHS